MIINSKNRKRSIHHLNTDPPSEFNNDSPRILSRQTQDPKQQALQRSLATFLSRQPQDRIVKFKIDESISEEQEQEFFILTKEQLRSVVASTIAKRNIREHSSDGT